jgi:hypothetical protein
MNIATKPIPQMPTGMSWRRVSAPAPYHAETAADRAIAALPPTSPASADRLRMAMGRKAAHNSVARGRLFLAVEAALATGACTKRHEAERHGALLVRGLAAGTPVGAPQASPGIAVQQTLLLAGKRIDLRACCRPLVVGHHACVRFVERSGFRAPGALHAAVLEAMHHALPVLVAHLAGGLAYRLRGGTAAVLLPAGEGAFLGNLRLLPHGDDVLPAFEAATWLHAAMLDTPQMQAREVLLAGLAPATLLEALPEAWWGLQPSVSGDRRVLAGLETVPLRSGSDLAARLASSPLMAGARIELDLACADTIASELVAARLQSVH